jgi:ATP-dependent DNA helicase RecG
LAFEIRLLRYSNQADADIRMTISVQIISKAQADKVRLIDEGQFSDVKAVELLPSKLTKPMSAFANADGGDLYIGISDKERQWNGFVNVEAANGHIQTFEDFFPLGTDCQIEFLKCDALQGLVMHVQIGKTQAISRASDGIPYLRRGAQSLPVNTPDKLKRLELNKGITSFENEIVPASKDLITTSEITIRFVETVVPNTEPEPWLKKQQLLRDEKPTVAGVLLFAGEPQAILPKRCGIKVYRYKTRESQGFREALAFDPKTIEGCLYDQIKQAVQITTEIVESIPRMGEEALESIKYPPEALHEIITNAMLHRDYSIADDIHIRIFDNRIEVQSPGRLPAHITPKNILDERFARNGQIVRILNKFPDPPNKDVGEGLNTAFSAMHSLGLREPIIQERDNSVLVIIRHEPLASPEQAILEY